MKIKIKQPFFKATKGSLQGIFKTNFDHAFRYNDILDLDLSNLSTQQTTDLLNLCEAHRSMHGMGVIIKDVKLWLNILKNPGVTATTKARSVEQFTALSFEWLKAHPTRRLYKQDEVSNTFTAYYVNTIEYQPPYDHGDRRRPPQCRLEMLYYELGVLRQETVTLESGNTVGYAPEAGFNKLGYYLETDELLSDYKATTAHYYSICNRVGLQMHATGKATTNVDGNPSGGFFSYNFDEVIMDRDGAPSRVVVDVFRESDKDERHRDNGYVRRRFWGKVKLHNINSDDEEDIDFEPDDRPDEDIVPILPNVVVFDLKRHLRLRIHADSLTEYVYNTKLGECLILPEDTRDIVDMLTQTQCSFQDIIAGKGSGAVILCAGPPGVGKTLSAEVYSETTQRPLYSIQCSQLGIKPDKLEEELTKAFARAQRWNAILLLDEADVYISQRGTDLVQNAIVGVFLRVLEYYSGTMFMTTNRGDLVDDAIASRCLAKITYTLPSPTAQGRIWKVVAEASGIQLGTATINQLVLNHGNVSGRDIKQLLKLANLVATARGSAITPAIVEFVTKFQPTISQ